MCLVSFVVAAFGFENWDRGRLRVNRGFADLLRANGLTTYEAVEQLEPVEIARHVGQRMTARVLLRDGDGERAFYLKKHGSAPLKEYIKPLFRLTWPVLGAQPEWDAILRFHRVGIPTMVPVALGRSGRRSFLLTESLENHERLDHWLTAHRCDPGESRGLTAQVAQLTRTMHAAGLHHQDFYLCHLLLPREEASPRVHVIDLGRARPHSHLSSRWIVKDLAQLHYSAGPLSWRERLRFLRSYLGRPLRRTDRRLIRRIERKAAAIARHSQKNRL